MSGQVEISKPYLLIQFAESLRKYALNDPILGLCADFLVKFAEDMRTKAPSRQIPPRDEANAFIRTLKARAEIDLDYECDINEKTIVEILDFIYGKAG